MVLGRAKSPEPLKLEALEAPGAGLRHGFFTRRGGVSRGLYESLNCGAGSDDDPARVAANRRRAKAALGLEAGDLVSVRQAHTADCVTVARPWPSGQGPKADAMATDRANLALGVLTADCAPVLFADAEAGVIAAAHAGWRGAVHGVLEAAVAAMETLGARRDAVTAGIGPTIAADSYEVGPEFPERLAAGTLDAAAFLQPAPRPGHYLFDLPGYVQARLAAAGIRQTAWVGGDTFAGEERFFSYRRACQRGEGDYGRLLSAIALVR
jgi:hypothetical protein